MGFWSPTVCVCHLDPAEHAGIEDVDASVDLVRDEDLWFLHKAVDPAAVRLKHHHAVLRGLLHPRHLHTQSQDWFINKLQKTKKVPN